MSVILEDYMMHTFHFVGTSFTLSDGVTIVMGQHWGGAITRSAITAQTALGSGYGCCAEFSVSNVNHILQLKLI